MPKSKHKINADLKPLIVRIDTLKIDPDNERGHDKKNLTSIAAALDKFGQQTPIVVIKKTGLIKKGNGTVMAVRDILGWTHIARVRFDSDDPVAITAYGITDNRTGELATWILPNLQASLITVKDGGVDLALLGWDSQDLDPILAATWEPPPTSDDPIMVYETIRVTTEQFNLIEEICKTITEDGKPVPMADALVAICQAHKSG